MVVPAGDSPRGPGGAGPGPGPALERPPTRQVHLQLSAQDGVVVASLQSAAQVGAAGCTVSVSYPFPFPFLFTSPSFPFSNP